jgi:hypothetical protein
MDQIQKNLYIKEHLPYETEMLRYTRSVLNAGSVTRLAWNALYESFAVHARNLYVFLTNEDGPNARAKDFVPAFRAEKDDHTKSIHQRFLAQVFHLGPKRPQLSEQKVGLSDISIYFSWIERNLESFWGELKEPYGELWPTHATACQSDGPISHGPTGPSWHSIM